MGSARRLLLPLLAALALAACGRQELHRDLTESQANAIVAALSAHGIDADKTGGDEGTWTVAVGDGDFAEAVSVLRQEGLPSETFVSLGEVFKKEGFTSSPLEERARLIFGLSQELSQTVSAIDGVVQARVHLTLPQPDPLTNEVPASSASVFVKYRPGFRVENQTGAIKTLVANSIEGISYERVSVVMVPAAASATAPEAGVLSMPDWLRIGFGACSVLLLLAGSWRLWHLRFGRAGARDAADPDPAPNPTLGRSDG